MNRRFTLTLAAVVAILTVVPFIFGLLMAAPGSRYLGFQYNTDDHMVYAAWMRQAMNGHFLFDNRFAIDPQPSLTIHLYFWALGLLAKVTGIGTAAAIARAVFSFLFVMILGRFVGLVTQKPSAYKLAMLLTCFGAGIGFLAWQPLGVDFLNESTHPLKGIMLSHLPNDVWQPEAFVFSSLLTNSLFAVGLCLIVGILYCVLRARDSWRPVPVGAIGMLLLMNIHSYDVLLIAFVLLGLLVCSIVQKQLTAAWLVRVVVIGLGAIPSALWFMYVLKHDPVFQARAATETYTENFRSIFFGYSLFMLVVAVGGLAALKTGPNARFTVGFIVAAFMVGGMFVAASSHASGYWMPLWMWCSLFIVALTATAFLSTTNPAVNLTIGWALIGLVAPYFPALFERKLMMGLSVPWAILAGLALAGLLFNLRSNEKRLVAALAVVLFAATSLRWLGREFQLIQANASNTTMQPGYLDADSSKIVDYLNEHLDDSRTVVLAMPGIPASLTQPQSPIYPDLNPILSGLTGAYTYAGHWSETPDYTKRRSEASRFFLKMTPQERSDLVKSVGATYIVAPIPEKWEPLHPIDQRDLGTPVMEGEKMRLIKVR